MSWYDCDMGFIVWRGGGGAEVVVLSVEVWRVRMIGRERDCGGM